MAAKKPRYIISFFEREATEPFHSIETEVPPVVPRKKELIGVGTGPTREVHYVEYGYALDGNIACHVLVHVR